MARTSALLNFPASIPPPHEPPTAHFCSPFISHPLPSAQPPFPPSFSAASPSCPERSRGVSTAFLSGAKPRGTPTRAVSPFPVAFTPNRPLTPLSTAFTQSHRGVGYPCVYLHSPRVTSQDCIRSTCKPLPRVTTFRMNTCKSVSKQRTLTSSRMNTYENPGGGGHQSTSR